MTNKITETSWHTMQIDEVIGNVVTNVNTGLNLTEVEDRLRKYGHNQLEEKEGVSPIMLFLYPPLEGDRGRVIRKSVLFHF